MKIKTSTLVIGAGVIAGALVLYFAKKPAEQPKTTPAPAPPPAGTIRPPGPYEAYVPFPSYGANVSAHKPNPLIQIYHPPGTT